MAGESIRIFFPGGLAQQHEVVVAIVVSCLGEPIHPFRAVRSFHVSTKAVAKRGQNRRLIVKVIGDPLFEAVTRRDNFFAQCRVEMIALRILLQGEVEHFDQIGVRQQIPRRIRGSQLDPGGVIRTFRGFGRARQQDQEGEQRQGK